MFLVSGISGPEIYQTAPEVVTRVSFHPQVRSEDESMLPLDVVSLGGCPRSLASTLFQTLHISDGIMVIVGKNGNEAMDGTSYEAPKLGKLFTSEKYTGLRKLYF